MRHLALGLASLLAGWSPVAAQPVPAPPATASPTSSPAQPAPMPQPPPAPPTAAPPPVPAGQPPSAPTFGYVYTPAPQPADGPAIREIDLSDQTIVTPGDLRVRVITSPDVVSVVARAVGREISLPQEQSGEFGGSAHVPALPWFLRGRQYAVEFVAAAATGRSTTVTLQLGAK